MPRIPGATTAIHQHPPAYHPVAAQGDGCQGWQGQSRGRLDAHCVAASFENSEALSAAVCSVGVASFTIQVVTIRHYRKYSVFLYNLNLMQFAVKGFSWDLVGVGVAHCLHHMQKSQPRQIRLGHRVLWFKADHGKQASAARQWCSVPMAWAFLQMMAVRPGAKMGWWGAVSLPSIKSLFVWCVCVCII